MSAESTTPDLVELTRRSIEAAEDIEAALSFYAPDAVWAVRRPICMLWFAYGTG